VDVDTSRLESFAKGLDRNLPPEAKAAARAQAEQVAGRLRQTVPRRTGRLAASVEVVPEDQGAAVSYGTGVPYAAYIEKRSHAAANATEGSDTMFAQACHQAAQQAVARA